MELILYQYNKEPAVFEDVGELEDIKEIFISVISGDEVALIEYKDGTNHIFNSSTSRFLDFYDGGYTIYDPSEGIDLLKDWRDRSSNTYDYLNKMAADGIWIY